MADPRKPKYQKIITSLRDQIAAGALSHGATLPSYRALMQQYGATVGVVRQAMQVLQSDGLIESVPRVGCRVTQAARKQRMIGVAIMGFAGSDYYLEQIRMLHDDLERCRCDVAIRFITSTESDAAIASACAWAGRLDGVLLTGRVALRIADAMNKVGVPLVLVGEPLDGPPPADLRTVSVDITSTVRQAVSHLAGLGHRRIALDSGDGSQYYDTLRRAFETCRSEYGIEGLRLRRSDEGGRPSVEHVLHTITSAQCPPTAVLVEGAHEASILVERLNAASWPVPARISVMAISGALKSKDVRPNLTCVLTPTHELIRRAVQMLNDHFLGAKPSVRVERLPGVYVAGDTCGLAQRTP